MTTGPATPGAAPYPRLVGDVGGTHARFGWVQAAGAPIDRIASYAGSDFAGFEAVLGHYLREQGLATPPAGAVGVATPVTGDVVAMTNRDWSFSVADVGCRLGFDRFEVLNDFATLALAVPDLASNELRPVGGGQAAAGAALALLGPGTGLGVSGLLPAAGGFVPMVGEGGHATLAAEDEREARVIALLRERYGHASAERALSGAGLVALCQACRRLAGEAQTPIEPAEVTARAVAGSDPACRDAVELFFAFLGSVAGNLALTFGARGGVYVGGGIVPQLGDWIERSSFRDRFEAKGRYRDYLAAIPTWVITATESPALRGANRALDR
ncbi:MAG: glucokinase [Caldimonas sp.]